MIVYCGGVFLIKFLNKAYQIKLSESSHLNYDKLTQEKCYSYVVMLSPENGQKMFFFKVRITNAPGNQNISPDIEVTTSSDQAFF